MNFTKLSILSRIKPARNLRHAAVTLHENIAAPAQARYGGLNSAGGGGATFKAPESAFNFSQSRCFSAEPDPRATWRVTVPGNQAYIIEREGKYLKTLYADPDAPHLLDPCIDKIAFTQSLEEKAVKILTQKSITADGHELGLGLILYVKVVDPYLATYGNGVKAGDSMSAFKNLAMMMMSTAVEKVSLGDFILKIDKYEKQKILKESIDVLDDMNKIIGVWGLKCSHFDVENFLFPDWLLKTFSKWIGKGIQERVAEEKDELQKWTAEAEDAACEEEVETIMNKYREARKKNLEELESCLKTDMKLKGYNDDDELEKKVAIVDEELRAKETKWIKEAEKTFREVKTRAEAISVLEGEHGKGEDVEVMFNKLQQETKAIVATLETPLKRIREIVRWMDSTMKEMDEFKKRQ